MRIVYVFMSNMSSYILKQMIIPQLEEGRHGVDVVGFFFVGDNCYLIKENDKLGERINSLSGKKKFLVMGCDQCCYQRDIADNLISNAKIGCFPDLYAAIKQAGGIDQVITL